MIIYNLNEKYNRIKISDNILLKEKENQNQIISDLNKDKIELNNIN